VLDGQPVPVGRRPDRAAVQVDLAGGEVLQALGPLGRPAVEPIVVVEVQFEQDLEIVAGPQSLEIPLDLDEDRGQGMGRR
jgi:hypothetical protein